MVTERLARTTDDVVRNADAGSCTRTRNVPEVPCNC
jgi:hypothetical protein